MYHILIADDESVERECIRFLIKEAGFPLEIQEASDGEDALSLIEKESIDILFTDIQMPLVDGLALSQKAIEMNPDIKIILFSGFSEFEYAKTAISLGVQYYILKPIDPDEFKSVMHKVITDLNQIQKEKQNLIKSASYEKQHLLLLAVNGAPKVFFPKPFPKFLEQFHQMALIQFTDDFFESYHEVFQNDIRKFLSMESDYLNLTPSQGVILFHKELVDPARIGADLYNFIQNTYGLSCYIAISNSFCGFKGIAETYNDLEQQMENRFFMPDVHVLLPDLNRTIYDIKFIFSDLLKELHRYEKNTTDESLNKLIEEIYRCSDLTNVIQIIRQSMDEVIRYFQQKEGTNRKEVEQIRQYIEKNYQKELSVERLAEQVYLTPDYLSRLFKKSTGQSLNQYIKSYRMKKAKELLQTTNRKVIDICSDVGYMNYPYFCQSFREYYGITPEKYRQEGVYDSQLKK